MTTQLLIIDPQNDFIEAHPERAIEVAPALPVAGSYGDMQRLAGLIDVHGAAIDAITVTLDSHRSVAVERVTFWRDASGLQVAPFTQIRAADVRAGKYMPNDPAVTEQVLRMLDELESAGRYTLMVWPVHCVIGSVGHQVVDVLATSLASWEARTGRQVSYVTKGENPLTEHYGVFQAEVPHPHVPATQFNVDLAARLVTGTELLLVAGEASSHCVAASVQQLCSYGHTVPARIALLSDCMSAVTGFEAAAEGFLDWARGRGLKQLTAAQAASELAA